MQGFRLLAVNGPDLEETPPSRTPRTPIGPNTDDEPKWFKRYWHIITAVSLFCAGMMFAFAELSMWGARPSALFFILILLGLAPVTAGIQFWKK